MCIDSGGLHLKTVPFPTISRSVRQVYRRRLLAPVFYLLFLSVLWLVTPLEGLVFPPQVTGEIPLQELRISHSHYITTTLSDLHFTGYTQNMSGYTNGYYTHSKMTSVFWYCWRLTPAARADLIYPDSVSAPESWKILQITIRLPNSLPPI